MIEEEERALTIFFSVETLLRQFLDLLSISVVIVTSLLYQRRRHHHRRRRRRPRQRCHNHHHSRSILSYK